jgi:Winged helix-turn helix
LEGEPVTEHDVLVGFRLRLFTLAEELGDVSEACRLMGVDRSTYYRLKRRVDRWGLEALNVRERRRPRMSNQIGAHLEQRIIAFALGLPATDHAGSPPSWPERGAPALLSAPDDPTATAASNAPS